MRAWLTAVAIATAFALTACSGGLGPAHSSGSGSPAGGRSSSSSLPTSISSYEDGVVVSDSATGSASASASASPSASTSAAPSSAKVAAAPKVAAPHAAPKTTVAAAPVVPGVSGGKPGPSNTGVPAGTALTKVTGNQTFTSGVHSGLEVFGVVTLKGSAALTSSIVHGPAAGAGCNDTGAINVSGGTSVLIQDVEIAPSAATACLDGIWASNAKLVRVNIHGTVDGVKADSSTTVQDSYIHDLTEFASDPNQGGGPTHNDAVQTFGAGSNIVLNHNTMIVSKSDNSDYQLTQDEGVPATRISVVNNWLYGGGCSLNFATKGGGAVTAAAGIVVQNNRFGQGSTGFDNCPILISNSFALAAFSGNVWDASGAAMTSYQQHD